ncbi:MAG: hypothetical protein RL708_2140 [Bacteroidota bacterium]|jgi:isoleucyl-tRNA synthetase
MTKRYPEHKQLSLPEIDKNILSFWLENKIFERSISQREGAESFVFYEGPPSANGMPGIHHVMARTIKDIFCRYQTMNGKQVHRKAGWDTHGLPVELSVEKSLGITKEDIGKKITVEEYNKKCREEVMKYQDKWEEVTRMMGYWVDMTQPYITYENTYIESLWWILKQFYNKGFLYKGLTIQPYSPAAGTGLSSHELNQPGCYRDVKDTTAVAQFKIKNENLKVAELEGAYFLAWTTTPWTLPSNTALAVGEKIDYVLVETINSHSHEKIKVVLAKLLLLKHFKAEGENIDFANYKIGDKIIPWKIISEFKGKDLEGICYEQLLPFEANTKANLEGPNDAWRVICDNFVTTEDGTGIVHIAPSFGADDFRVAKQNNIGALTMVDKRGKFLSGINDGVYLFGEEFIKEAYLTDDEKKNEFAKQKQILEAAGKVKELKSYLSVDTRIVLKLQEEGKLFKKENYEHSYPHCWRTDKPVIYYPLDSWFIAVTKVKEKMVAMNKTINWKPEATGVGRFGNWLENANDWNLSRSRFWGTPLPIWRTEDGTEEIVIGSLEELYAEIEKSIAVGFEKKSMEELKSKMDLHKPFVDGLTLVSASGKPMKRESDLIDVWFDSGAMPLAQWHYPFENNSTFSKNYPADFIAEGVDQTRGWFYTLHAIAVMLHEIDPEKFPGVAYKNVISNGLVLDKNGEKMSKRLGNAVDPFEAIPKYGADAIRWYMVENANPWDNLKFDFNGIDETRRKFFGTLYNTYGFFALYANVDGFSYAEDEVPLNERPEIDRWIISLLNSLIKEVKTAYDEYEPTKAARAIQEFVDEHFSNWYIRLCRRRFWKGEYEQDKIAAYQTLYTCLETLSQLMSPVAPFFAEWLFKNLNDATGRIKIDSVHLSDFPKVDESCIDAALEERMQMAQDISSLVLSLRKKVNIKVRQPLQKIIVPVLSDDFKHQLTKVQDLILSEVNVKELEMITETEGIIKKKIKANFKTLGAKLGKQMKEGAAQIANFSQHQISEIEKTGLIELQIADSKFQIALADVEITAEDIPGWQVANKGILTVALDTNLTQQLENEGIARELVNQIQKIRKESNFNITDRINVTLEENTLIKNAIDEYKDYICAEILAENIDLKINMMSDASIEINEQPLKIIVHHLN